MFIASAPCMGQPGAVWTKACCPPSSKGPSGLGQGQSRPEPPVKAPLQDSSPELQEIAEFGGRTFSPGFNHTQSQGSRGCWLANLVPLPPCSPQLIAGLEPGPRLNLSLLHVSLWCCFFHEHIQEIKKVGKDLGIAPTIIRDEELKTRGFGGEWEPGPAGHGLRAQSRVPWMAEGQWATWCVVQSFILKETGLCPSPRPDPGKQTVSGGERRQWFRL